jgi:glutamyl-tRNA reductase
VSILVVGISHRTADVDLLERLALRPDQVEKLVVAVQGTDHVREATALATCNRVEIYTEVDRFHGSVESITRALCDFAGESVDDVVPHLYVHYDDGAVSHLFHVAAGLDSMVVGEGQILSQTRESLRLGQELGAVGPVLNAAFQQALRVAKRAHTETDIDRAAPSLVSVTLERATDWLDGLGGRRVVVIGAGAMASLTVSSLSRAGAGDLVVINRTVSKAERLASQYDARHAPLSHLAEELAGADLVVSCTGAVGTVVTADMLLADRGVRRAVVDLALPHDVDPAVADIEGVLVVGLRELAVELSEDDEALVDVIAVRRIVAEEVRAFLDARRVASVTPTVVALRSMATEVVAAEVTRLTSRVPGLDPALRHELEQALHRVAHKLVHQPTVRVKELANTAAAVSYAEALAELFAIDPQAVAAVTSAGSPELLESELLDIGPTQPTRPDEDDGSWQT